MYLYIIDISMSFLINIYLPQQTVKFHEDRLMCLFSLSILLLTSSMKKSSYSRNSIYIFKRIYKWINEWNTLIYFIPATVVIFVFFPHFFLLLHWWCPKFLGFCSASFSSLISAGPCISSNLEDWFLLSSSLLLNLFRL